MNQDSPLPDLSRLAYEATTDTVLFVVGPILVFLVAMTIYFMVIVVKRRKDEARLTEAMELPDAEEAAAAPTPQSHPPIEDEVAQIRATDQSSWLARLRGGLTRTRDTLGKGLAELFTGKIRLDDSTLEQLHEALFRADTGVETADKLVEAVRRELHGEASPTWDRVRGVLQANVASILKAQSRMPEIAAHKPFVLLVVGVNGVGKTTTIGKLAAHFLAEDKTVLLAAADTYRAAAIDQLQTWGSRLGVEVIAHKQGSDPAAVAYDAVKAAMARKLDVLIIDTAGRLHSKAHLMDELGKINRVIGKDLPGAPHEVWLVIDATTGQNAFMQVKAFREVVPLTGLVVTKLDGTAKGGVVVGVVDQFKLPIQYIGVGEQAADLRAFRPEDFAHSML